MVTGVEGCGKSRQILTDILKGGIVDYETGYVIYAMQSYKMLAERQAEIMEYHELTKEECPILTLRAIQSFKGDQENLDLMGGKPQRTYSKGIKIALMTTAAIKKCHHLRIEPVDRAARKTIRYLIIDEFDFASSVIPRIDYIQSTLATTNKSRSSKKEVSEYIRSQYSDVDCIRYRESLVNRENTFLLAHYLDSLLNDFKIVFVSSEHVAATLLKSVGFDTHQIGTTKGLAKHKLHIKSDKITTHTYNRLNNEGLWGMFMFETVISDRYDPANTLGRKIEVINHMSIRGSNRLEGKQDVLTIVSHVPQIVIESIVDCINQFAGHQEVKFAEVQATYYRDRLMQAVGRTIGYRGTKHGVYEAWAIVSDTLWRSIVSHMESGHIEIPYTLLEWDMQIKEWEDLKTRVAEDRRIATEKQTKGNQYRSEMVAQNKERARQAINKYIVRTGNDTDYVEGSQLKKLFTDVGIAGITAKFAANYLGATMQAQKVDGKTARVLVGYAIK